MKIFPEMDAFKEQRYTGDAFPGKGGPLVVVIIPVYKHSVFVTESVFSVLDQESSLRIATVIVDDGCPYVETAVIGLSLSAAHEDVYYVRKPNGGLSAARNFGIDYALKRFPSAKAIYFLDSDNRISPTTIESCYKLLDTDKKIGWIYPNIDKFGVEWCVNLTGSYSKLLHVVAENICEAGSMVAREVLEGGVRFDENMKAGCEDWEFWLQCLDAGYVGKNNPFFGFEYRSRGESMVTDTARDIISIREYMRKKHPSLHSYARLVEYEHLEAPRFACLSPATGEALLFTDPAQTPNIITHEEALVQFYAGQMEPDSVGLPAILTWFKPEIIQKLSELGLVWSLFNIIEKQVQTTNFIAVSLEHSETSIAFEIAEVSDKNSLNCRLHGWATQQQLFKEILLDPSRSWVSSLRNNIPDPKVVLIRIKAPFNQTLISKNALPASLSILATIEAADSLGLDYGTRQRWTWRHDYLPHVTTRAKLIEKMIGAEHVMPRIPVPNRVHVALCLPITAFGGVERVAFAVAAELKKAGCCVHLYCFGESEVKLHKSQQMVFDSVNFFSEKNYSLWGGSKRFMGHDLRLEYDEDAMARRILGMLGGIDVLINCHVAPLNAAIGQLRRAGVKIVNHLHVLDSTPFGRPVGHPYIGLGFEHAHDVFLTCSLAMRDWLHGLGVPIEKTMFIENAGGYMPSHQQLSKMEQSRAQRSTTKPLQVLFMGRLDTQKGVERLVEAIDQSQRRGLELKWRVIGSEIISAKGSESWGARLARYGVQLEPPIYNANVITDVFTKADIFVLPSRWEGAPLAIIEAQRLGCVPIATDVGAVNELIDNGRDGILLQDGSDNDVAAALVDHLAAISLDRKNLHAMSRNAIDRGYSTNWENSVKPLLGLIRTWFPAKMLT